MATPVYSKADTMTLTAAASGGVALMPVTSGDIVFSAGAANKLAFTTQPSASTVTGEVFAQQPVVTIQDANGNTVTSASNSVNLILATGTGTLGGTTTKTAISGVATFTDLSIDMAGTNKSLVATSGTLTPAVTYPDFEITAGAASKLAYTVVPDTGTVGTAFSVTVQ
jgi:hypothetical protein